MELLESRFAIVAGMVSEAPVEEEVTPADLQVLDEVLMMVAGKRGKSKMDGPTSSAEVPKKKSAADGSSAAAGSSMEHGLSRPRMEVLLWG